MKLREQLASLRARPGLLATVGVGLTVHAAALWLVGITPAPAPRAVAPAPFVYMTEPEGPTNILRDQALLLDSAPLFLPTAWNTAPAWQERVEAAPDPNLFEAFPDEVTLQQDAMRPELPASTVADGLEQAGALDPLAALGRASRSTPALPARSAFFEIREMETGRIIASGAIQGDDALTAVPMVWQPAEFLFRASPEGIVGAPLQSQGSGNDGVDGALRALITRSPRIQTLPPGYYSITIGP